MPRPGSGDLLAGPLALGRGQAVQAAADVVQGRQQQVVAGGAHAVEGHALCGREQHGEVPVAGQERVQADREQRVLGEGAAAGFPVGAQGQQQVLLEDALQVGVVGDVQLHHPAVEDQVGGAGEEGGCQVGEVVATLGLDVGVGADRDVGGLALEHRDRSAHGRAPRPGLDQPRVARLGQRAGAEIGAQPEGVLVLPADPGLGLGHREAAVDEGLGHGVELAHHRRIAAAPGQGDQAEAGLGLQEVGALPHPVLALGRGQGVQVQHRLPDRFGRDVLVQEGAAPQAAHVLGVLPVVVQPGALDADGGDAVAGVVDLQQLGVDRRELRHRLEHGRVLGAALLDPLEGLLALDLLEPEVGVLVLGRSGQGQGHQQHQHQGKQQGDGSRKHGSLSWAGVPGRAV